MNVKEKLTSWYEMKSAIQLADEQKQAEIDKVLTPELLKQVEDIRQKWNDTTESMNAECAALEAEIKADVLAVGATVKSEHVMAVWNKGRVSWDSKKLDGMMALVPQLEQARKVGEPTVSFRFT